MVTVFLAIISYLLWAFISADVFTRLGFLEEGDFNVSFSLIFLVLWVPMVLGTCSLLSWRFTRSFFRRAHERLFR